MLQVREGLGHIDPYFTKLADAMVTWIEAWRSLNPSKGAQKEGTVPAANDTATAAPAPSTGKATTAGKGDLRDSVRSVLANGK